MRNTLLAAIVSLSFGCATAPVPAECPAPVEVETTSESAAPAAAVTTTTPVDLAQEEAAVRASSTALAEAERNQDPDAAASFFADDAIAVLPGAQPLHGRAQIREQYAAGWRSAKILQQESAPVTIRVSDSGDVAYEQGWNQVTVHTRKGARKDRTNYLIVWRKQHGFWKVAALAFAYAPLTR